jgi:hypothetical protein
MPQPIFEIKTQKFDRTSSLLTLSILSVLITVFLTRCVRYPITSLEGFWCAIGLGTLIFIPFAVTLASLLCNTTMKLYLKDNTLFCEQANQITAIPCEKISDVLRLSEGLIVLGAGKAIGLPAHLLHKEVSTALEQFANPLNRLRLDTAQARFSVEQRLKLGRLQERRDNLLLLWLILCPLCTTLIIGGIQQIFKLPVLAGWSIWVGLTLCGGSILACRSYSFIERLFGNLRIQDLDGLLLLVQIADDGMIRQYLGWLIEHLYIDSGTSPIEHRVVIHLLNRILPTVTAEDYHSLTKAQKRRMLLCYNEKKLWETFVRYTLQWGSSEDLCQLLYVLRFHSWDLKQVGATHREQIEEIRRKAQQLLAERAHLKSEELLRIAEAPVCSGHELLRSSRAEDNKDGTLLKPMLSERERQE